MLVELNINKDRATVQWTNKPAQPTVAVKNLGWLHRHQNEAVQVEIEGLDNHRALLVVHGVKRTMYACYDWTFRTEFESLEVCLNHWYARRRVLKSLPLKLKSVTFKTKV